MENDGNTKGEMTSIVSWRYDPASWEKARGVVYPRSSYSHSQELTIVRESPGEVLEKLFPLFRIFEYRELDFRNLDFNSGRYSGLGLKTVVRPARTNATVDDFCAPRDLRSVRRRVTNRDPFRLSMEAIKIVDFMASETVNAFVNNEEKYRALEESLTAFRKYLNGPSAQDCIDKASKFMAWWDSACGKSKR